MEIALAILLILVVLVSAGMLYQRAALAKDKKLYPPPGQMVDIGGYRLHMQISGQGSPVVILEAGFGDYSIHWKEIQTRLEKVTRVVSYDRAGMGWSDASPHPRTPEQVADELYSALKKAGIEGPYVIMGHSLGGLFARHFARRHPDEMAGVLLLDSFHEIDELPQELKYVHKDVMKAINTGSILAPLGIYRVLTLLRKKNHPEPMRTEARHALDPKTYRAYKGEFLNVLHTPAPFEAGDLKDIPLIVLWAEGNISVEALKGNKKITNPEETVRATRALIKANNEQLTTLSSRSELLASPASHYIQRDDPDLVVGKMLELIEAKAAVI